MRIISAPDLATSELAPLEREILCLELDPAAHLLLWSCRELLTARQENRAYRHVLCDVKGAPDRSSTVLLRLLISELAVTTRRYLHFGLPHCQTIRPDELVLLAAIDRLQVSDDILAGLLLQKLCENTDVTSLLETATHLGTALKQCGSTIRVMRLVPTALIPSIH